MKNRCGEEKLNNKGSPMKIIRYNGCEDILVEFQDEHKHRVKTNYSNFKKGKVKNIYFKHIKDIGYIGNSNIRNDDKSLKRSYSIWSGMIERCYDRKRWARQPMYECCSVCKEWLCYKNFEKWYNENYYEIENEKIELDKDILVSGNKIYSPNTCVFIPKRINVFIANNRVKNSTLPIGVTKHGNKYTVRAGYMKENGEVIRKYLGVYDNVTDAFLAYKTQKEKCIKDIANTYKYKIPEKLYNAMICWKVDTTDELLSEIKRRMEE